MRNLSHPVSRRRLHVSLPVMVACLTLPAAALAEPTGMEHAARGVGVGSGGSSDKPASLITVKNASGTPGEPIPLAVTVSARPGQSVSNTYLVGLPKGARLATDNDTAMATDEKTAIDVTHWDLPRLSVVLSPTQAGTYTLAVVAASRPDIDGPMTFTSSTFTLKAIAESREAEPAVGASALRTSTPGTKQPDTAAMREALRPPLSAPLPAAMPSNMAAQAGAITPKLATAVSEIVRPKILVNLWREETSIAANPSRAVAPPSSGDRRSTEFQPPAAAAPPALAALPIIAPATIAPVATPLVATPLAPAAEVDGKALVERAERLIRLGDISGARLVLERAADRGDPRATFLLAQTCDPRMLRAWKVQGLRPDPDRARALYAKAAQEGLRETKPVTDAGR